MSPKTDKERLPGNEEEPPNASLADTAGAKLTL